MAKKKEPTAAELIHDIKRRLDNIEDMMAWTVHADQRFKVGQRVQFSRAADRNGLSQGRKGGVRTGRITAIDSKFSMLVLLDGYKKASSYHHVFFDALARKGGRR